MIIGCFQFFPRPNVELEIGKRIKCVTSDRGGKYIFF